MRNSETAEEETWAREKQAKCLASIDTMAFCIYISLYPSEGWDWWCGRIHRRTYRSYLRAIHLTGNKQAGAAGGMRKDTGVMCKSLLCRTDTQLETRLLSLISNCFRQSVWAIFFSFSFSKKILTFNFLL